MSIDPVSLAITAALTAANMALQMSRKIEGPRLEDLSVTVADYGTLLNYFYGIRRFEGCPIIWAEPIREQKRKRKTKGGKYNEYTYYGTWAVAVADHEIDAVSRIWFDKHLVFDVTGAGPVLGIFGEGIDRVSFDPDNPASVVPATMSAIVQVFSKGGAGMRIYRGAETQEADPRILATVEAEHGAGSCPAYRGVSYIVFEDVPLEKFGNRIPQITVEAISNKTDAYPYESRDTDLALNNFIYSPDFSRFLTFSSTSVYEIFDVAARSMMISGTLPESINNEPAGISNAGTIYAVAADGSSVITYSPDGFLSGGDLFAFNWVQDGLQVISDGRGTEHVLTLPYSVNQPWYSLALGSVSDAIEHVPEDETGYEWQPRHFFRDSYGDIWAVGSVPTVLQTPLLYLQRVVDTGARPGSTGFAEIATPNAGTSFGTAVYGAHYDGNFIISWAGSRLYLIDDETFTISANVANANATFLAFANLPPGASSIWLSNAEISLSDLSTIRSPSLSLWNGEDGFRMVYDPINHALISKPQFISHINWLYLDRVTSAGVTLRTVAEDIARRSGMDSGNHDFTALTQTVKGYSWTQGAGKEILEPLFDAHDSDIRPHDFSVQGKLRTGSSLGTLSVANYVRDGDTRYAISITQDSDLPRSLTFSFADLAGDQQTNSILVQRPLDAVDSVRALTIDMTTMAEDVDTARQLAERYFRNAWFSRHGYSLGLTPQDLALEPGDNYTLALDDVSHEARCRRTTISAAGPIKTEWVRRDASLSALSGSSGADMDGRVPAVIPVPGLTKGIVIDAPLAIDGHDSTTPLIYYAAAPYGTDIFWMGADFSVSDDGDIDGYEPGWAAVASQDAMTWGSADNALGDALATVIDYGNTLTVNMHYGTLASSTEDLVLANGALNLIAVQSGEGWEYIQFITATLTAADTYDLTGLVRGCRGTEQYTSSHAAGDPVIVMGAGSLRRTMGASEIGDTDYYRPVSQGRALESGFVQALTFTASANRPYSPVHGTLTKESNGDWTIAATRRTRIGGANVDGQAVPLGEVSEAYEADIMDGSTVVRTITGASLPLTYTDAQQVTDWGSSQSALDANLYQMSPSLALRGYPLALAA